jgi:hypothetical protein
MYKAMRELISLSSIGDTSTVLTQSFSDSHGYNILWWPVGGGIEDLREVWQQPAANGMVQETSYLPWMADAS